MSCPRCVGGRYFCFSCAGSGKKVTVKIDSKGIAKETKATCTRCGGKGYIPCPYCK